MRPDGLKLTQTVKIGTELRNRLDAVARLESAALLMWLDASSIEKFVALREAAVDEATREAGDE